MFLQIVPPTRNSLLFEVTQKRRRGVGTSPSSVSPRTNTPSELALDIGHHAIERPSLFANECSAFLVRPGKLLFRIVEAFPRLVQIRFIAWKKRSLTIELLNFPKLSGVQPTIGQRAFDSDTKSVLILLQGVATIRAASTSQPSSSCSMSLICSLIRFHRPPRSVSSGVHALRDRRARRPMFRFRDIQRLHGQRDAMDIAPNGFGASI